MQADLCRCRLDDAQVAKLVNCLHDCFAVAHSDAIGASLKYARAKLMKLTRQAAPGSNTDGRNGSGGSRSGAAPADDPWATSSPKGGSDFDSEPPF